MNSLKPMQYFKACTTNQLVGSKVDNSVQLSLPALMLPSAAGATAVAGLPHGCLHGLPGPLLALMHCRHVAVQPSDMPDGMLAAECVCCSPAARTGNMRMCLRMFLLSVHSALLDVTQGDDNMRSLPGPPACVPSAEWPQGG